MTGVTRRTALATLAAAPLVAAAPLAIRRTQIGANVFDLFLSAIQFGPAPGTANLELLSRRGVPFVRFAASGFWATDWARFEAEPAQHWSTMDTIFAAAEHHGVKLVPSLLWQAIALAFHCGEPMLAWGDPASKTRALADRYTETFVARYDHSPALLMYEFANELNVWVDLPSVLQFWPNDQTMPQRKPQERDKITSTTLRDAGDGFVAAVRKHSGRPISMGTSLPRSNAWHLARGSWDKDTPVRNFEQLKAVTPLSADVLSIHLYPDLLGRTDSVFSEANSALRGFAATAAAERRLSYVGEFGVPRMADRAAERRAFADLLEAVAGSGIDYASVWNVGRHAPDPAWTITASNDRAYQLEAIVAANR